MTIPAPHDIRSSIVAGLEHSIARLARWCDQNSWSLDSDRLTAMASMLQTDFASLGVELNAVELPPVRLLSDQPEWTRQPTGPALIWHRNPDADKRLLLMIHYDTVYPVGSQPNHCVRHGDRLIGPGTADAKGGIAVIAMAVAAILKFDLASSVGLSILLNPDEEIGSSGSREVMQELAPQFDAALLFEPTLPDGSLVATRKGSGNFSLVVRGKSAHAGRNPEAGRNAIVHLARLIPILNSWNRPDEGTLVNVGRVNGGGPLNQVPDHAVIQLNIRVANQVAMDRVIAELNQIANQHSDTDYRVSLQGEFHCPPKLLNSGTEQLQRQVETAAVLAGRQIVWKDTSGACDGSKLAALGLPNIDTLGVSGGGLHSGEEFCDLESLVPAAHTVVAFVENFAHG